MGANSPKLEHSLQQYQTHPPNSLLNTCLPNMGNQLKH